MLPCLFPSNVIWVWICLDTGITLRWWWCVHQRNEKLDTWIHVFPLVIYFLYKCSTVRCSELCLPFWIKSVCVPSKRKQKEIQRKSTKTYKKSYTIKTTERIILYKRNIYSVAQTCLLSRIQNFLYQLEYNTSEVHIQEIKNLFLFGHMSWDVYDGTHFFFNNSDIHWGTGILTIFE